MSSSIPAPHRCLNQSTLGALHPLRTQSVVSTLVLGEQGLLLGRCFYPCQCYPLPLPLLQFRGFLQKRASGHSCLLPLAANQWYYKIRFSRGFFGDFFFLLFFLPSSGFKTVTILTGERENFKMKGEGCPYLEDPAGEGWRRWSCGDLTARLQAEKESEHWFPIFLVSILPARLKADFILPFTFAVLFHILLTAHMSTQNLFS